MAYEVIATFEIPEVNEQGNYTGEATVKRPGETVTKKELGDNADEVLKSLIEREAVKEV